MKRLLPTLSILVLAGCSSGAIGGDETLAPLPTTGVPIIDTIPTTDKQFTEEQTSFLDDVYFFYGATPPMSDDEVVQMGELWCQLMTDGMTADDVISRINGGASDNDDAKLHYSMVMSGGENLCKDQFAKAESIALRYLTP
jgi:folate-dependent tRNA-U54 methylase TrmFO/GidA